MRFSDAVKSLKVSLNNLKREEEKERRALMHNLEFRDGVMIVLLTGDRGRWRWLLGKFCVNTALLNIRNEKSKHSVT